MKISIVSPRRWLAAAVIALTVSTGSLFFVSQADGGDEGKGPGSHSGFTREELRSNWAGAARFPLLVPARLPTGAEQHPEVGFVLNNVVTDPVRHPSKREWVSYYQSDVLGGRGTSFRIFQRPRQAANRNPCGPITDQPIVQRRVGNATLTICSAALSRGTTARQYWEGVPFTSELERVGWLSG